MHRCAPQHSCVFVLFIVATIGLHSISSVQALCGDYTLDGATETCDPPSATCSIDCGAQGTCAEQCVRITPSVASCASGGGTECPLTIEMRVVPCEMRVVSAIVDGALMIRDHDIPITCDADGSGTVVRVVLELHNNGALYQFESVFLDAPEVVCPALRNSAGVFVASPSTVQLLSTTLTSPSGQTVALLEAVDTCPRARCYTIPFSSAGITIDALFDRSLASAVSLRPQTSSGGVVVRNAASTCMDTLGSSIRQSAFTTTGTQSYTLTNVLSAATGVADPRFQCGYYARLVDTSAVQHESIELSYPGGATPARIDDGRSLASFERVCRPEERAALGESAVFFIDPQRVMPSPVAASASPSPMPLPSALFTSSDDVLDVGTPNLTRCYALNTALWPQLSTALPSRRWAFDALWRSQLIGDVTFFVDPSVVDPLNDGSHPVVDCSEPLPGVALLSVHARDDPNSRTDDWIVEWQFRVSGTTPCATLFSVLDQGEQPGFAVDVSVERFTFRDESAAGALVTYQRTSRSGAQSLLTYEVPCPELDSSASLQPALTCRTYLERSSRCLSGFGYTNSALQPVLLVFNSTANSLLTPPPSTITFVGGTRPPSVFAPATTRANVFVVEHECSRDIAWRLATPNADPGDASRCQRACYDSLFAYVIGCALPRGVGDLANTQQVHCANSDVDLLAVGTALPECVL